ncbi:MAG: peptidase U35 [Aestuariivirga sp.]|nr:peptidase U35 [Aestuariivirga sp.]
MIIRRAPLTPQSWNADERTLEVVFSTGAPVERFDARGVFEERLSLDQDWSGFRGAPVLNAHRRDSIEDVIGSVTSARTVGQEARAVIKLSRRADVEPVIQDILDGILRGVSVGYIVHDWKETTDGARRIKTATRWQPVELSIVPIPADRLATIRGQDMTTPNPATTPNDEATPVDRAAVNTAIRSIAELANLDQGWIDKQIDGNATVEQARAAAFDAMQQRSQQTRTITSTAHNTATLDNPEVRARAMGEAIFARLNPAHEVSGAARNFVGLSVPELGRECLRSAGVSVTGMSASQIVTRALHSTSDFAIALGDAVGRTMRQAYSEAPSGLKTVARMTTMRDFRERKRIQTSQFDRLEKVNEAGEFKRGSFKEEAEAYKLATFGKVFGITRQALVNDDLGVFNDVPRKLGIAAAAFEAQALVDLLISGSGAGPLMSDSKRLFHTDHGNLAASAGVPDETRLSAARLAMRKQKDASGQFIAVAPRYIVIPSELETGVEKLLSTVQAAETANVSAFAGKLTPVVEPRLTSGTAWYLAADPALIVGLEYAHLEGEPGPQIETRAGFDVDGIETRIRLDFGCGFIDWRGWYRNAG